MSNGEDINERLEFEEQIAGLSEQDLLKFIARRLYDHCEEQKWFAKAIRSTARQTMINKYALVALVVMLIMLGVLDASVIHIFG